MEWLAVFVCQCQPQRSRWPEPLSGVIFTVYAKLQSKNGKTYVTMNILVYLHRRTFTRRRPIQAPQAQERGR